MIFDSLLKEENRSKKIFIRILSALIGFTLSMSIFYFFLGLGKVSFLHLIAALLSPFGIWLTLRNFFLLAKVLMHLVVLFVILGSNSIYGNESMILAFLVPLVQSALTIFKKSEWRWTAGFLVLILILVPLFVLADLRFSAIELKPDLLILIQLINVVGSVGFAVIQITYVSSINEQFSEALELRNREAENTNELLKSALSTRDQLFNMLAHDLRSPFVALESGFIILSDLPIPEDKKWIVKEIRDNAKSTLNLLDNTLSWARSQIDNIQFEPCELPVQEVLNKISQSFSVHLRSKGISLFFETGPDLRTFADANMLSSILQNLVSNAIKFTPREGNIWISVMGLMDGTEFRIRDSGTGMDQEDVNQILSGGTFSKPGTGREKGHGVGLLLVREFLSRHGSTLHIKSAPGKGTEFSFTLPGLSPLR